MEPLKILLALVAILNPVGAVPVFLTITRNRPPRDRLRMALTTAGAVAAVLIGALLAGEAVLAFFDISVASFRVGGGILILVMAMAMLHGSPTHAKNTPEETAEAAKEEATSVAIVPLAMPLLAGPGSIGTVILYADRYTAMAERMTIIGLILALLVLGCLVLAVSIGRRLGGTGIKVLTRLMGLLLAAIAVEFIADGLGELLPGLAVTG